MAASSLPDRIAFLGFGLIGGSLAMALRDAGSRAHLVAWTPAGTGPNQGLARGVLNEVAVTPGAAIEGSGLVILAGPPHATAAMVDDVATTLRGFVDEDATITDVASTKQQIIERAIRHRLPFVGGHPMAGRESAGFQAATHDLFRERPWVIVEIAEVAPRHVDRVETLALAAGAKPVRMPAGIHDQAVAGISHLPLVLAAALVEVVAEETWLDAKEESIWPIARTLAASGWRDMTRLARGDVDMGAGILATNPYVVTLYLRELQVVLDRWIERLGGGRLRNENLDDIRDRLAAVRAVLDQDQPT